MVVLAGVAVVVGDREAAQGLKLGRMVSAQVNGGAEAVGEQRVAAGAGGAQAVQELEARGVLHVQQVHV